jgi:hypothetical protein
LLKSFLGSQLHGNSFIKGFLTFLLDGISLSSSLGGDSFVLTNTLSDNRSSGCLLLDDHGLLLYLLGSFDKFGLFGLEFGLHDTDRAFSLDQTIVTVGVTILKVLNLCALGSQKNLEGTNELQVRGGGHVVVSLELTLEFPRRLLSILMELLQQLALIYSSISISPKNFSATDCRASFGHSENQSMVVQLTSDGKFLTLFLNESPMGEKQSTICKKFLQRSTKYEKSC